MVLIKIKIQIPKSELLQRMKMASKDIRKYNKLILS